MSHGHICPCSFLDAHYIFQAACVSSPYGLGSSVHGSRKQLPHFTQSNRVKDTSRTRRVFYAPAGGTLQLHHMNMSSTCSQFRLGFFKRSKESTRCVHRGVRQVPARAGALRSLCRVVHSTPQAQRILTLTPLKPRFWITFIQESSNVSTSLLISYADADSFECLSSRAR